MGVKTVRNKDMESNDVKPHQAVEEGTSSDPSSPTPVATQPVEQTTVEQQVKPDEQPVDENRIPHSRVKEMLAKEREKVARELMSEFQQHRKKESPPPQPIQPAQPAHDDQTEAALRLVKSIVREELEPVKAQSELHAAMSLYPDLPEYKAEMISVIKQNPGLGFTDAYKLAKFDKVVGSSGMVAATDQKRASSVESAGRQTTPRKSEINVWDKKTSLADLEQQINEMAAQGEK